MSAEIIPSKPFTSSSWVYDVGPLIQKEIFLLPWGTYNWAPAHPLLLVLLFNFVTWSIVGTNHIFTNADSCRVRRTFTSVPLGEVSTYASPTSVPLATDVGGLISFPVGIRDALHTSAFLKPISFPNSAHFCNASRVPCTPRRILLSEAFVPSVAANFPVHVVAYFHAHQEAVADDIAPGFVRMLLNQNNQTWFPNLGRCVEWGDQPGPYCTLV
jgi:hypothetical protein